MLRKNLVRLALASLLTASLASPALAAGKPPAERAWAALWEAVAAAVEGLRPQPAEGGQAAGAEPAAEGSEASAHIDPDG